MKKAKKSARVESRADRERRAWTAIYRFVTGRTDHYARAADALGLTMPQTTVLRVLEPETPLPMVALATTLACHPSNVTGLVDRLEEQGLVARHPSEEDRRVKQVLLTEKGAETRSRLCRLLYAPPEELARLDDEDLAALQQVFEKLSV